MSRSVLQFLFYFFWIVTLLIQSYFVELQGDEAYYWMYSKSLAWGYFDHPPLSAVLIKFGYSLFKNELGVRLFFVLLSTATIVLMELLIRPVNLKLFYAVVLSIAFLQIGMVFGGGMFAIPDFPLLFFTALFFYLYRNYLVNPITLVIVGLSIVMSLLMLSKYHGVLIIGFTVLSNLSLLKNKSFWLMAVLTALFLTPHILWQYSNGFPSINYHFFERSTKAYSVSYTIEYLLSQPFVLGPFIGAILIYLSVKYHPEDLFERSLKFLAIGTYVFFFVMSFKGRVEGNWTVITLIPLLYLGYRQIERSQQLSKLAGYSFAVSIVLILSIRIVLIANLFPDSMKIKHAFRSRQWANELSQKSGGKSVVFYNSYQRASLYQFYSGVPTTSLNNIWGRKNQFTIWDIEHELQGKPVTIVSNWPDRNWDSIRFTHESFPYRNVENFRAASNVFIECDLRDSAHVSADDTIQVHVSFAFINSNRRDMEASAEFSPRVVYSFFQQANLIEMHASDLIITNAMFDSNKRHLMNVKLPNRPSEYDFHLSVQSGWLPPGINSRKVKVVVE